MSVPKEKAVPVNIASVNAVWIASISYNLARLVRRVVRRYAELIRKEYSWRHSSQRKKLLLSRIWSEECLLSFLLALRQRLRHSTWIHFIVPLSLVLFEAVRGYRHLQGDMSFPSVSTSSCPEKQIRHIRSSASSSL